MMLYDLVWCCMIWYDLVWSGIIWYDLVWSGIIWYAMVWCGIIWYVLVWSGVIWYDVATITVHVIFPFQFVANNRGWNCSVCNLHALHLITPWSKVICWRRWYIVNYIPNYCLDPFLYYHQKYSKTIAQLSGFTVAANVDDFSQQPVLPQKPQVQHLIFSLRGIWANFFCLKLTKTENHHQQALLDSGSFQHVPVILGVNSGELLGVNSS